MALTWFDDAAELKAKGVPRADFIVTQVYSGLFPWVKDGATARQEVELVNARVFKVAVGDDAYAAMLFCRQRDDGKPEWCVYCTDKQVSGEHTDDGKTLAAALRKEGTVSGSVANMAEASAWVGVIPDHTHCNFFNMLARSGKFCSHTAAVLAQVQPPDFQEMATQLKDWKSGKAVKAPVAMGPMSPEEAAFYDAAFINHVLLAGERGAGKTYMARMAADRYDAVYLEMQMHPSMEAWEFRSHDRAFNGKVYTVQGPFAQAVAAIRAGKKVVLCMDEFLNMNPMYATVINTPLSLSTNKDGEDIYLINTGSLVIDEASGTAKEEIVEVPADMLWVVATSNIGARYGLDKIAPSVRARFQVILMNTNAARTQTIVEKNLAKYDMPKDLGAKFKAFIDACNQAVEENTLDEEATTRLACNVVRACALKAKRDGQTYKGLKEWLPVIKKQVLVEIAQVVNFELGPLDPDQATQYKSIVEAAFRA